MDEKNITPQKEVKDKPIKKEVRDKATYTVLVVRDKDIMCADKNNNGVVFPKEEGREYNIGEKISI